MPTLSGGGPGDRQVGREWIAMPELTEINSGNSGNSGNDGDPISWLAGSRRCALSRDAIGTVAIVKTGSERWHAACCVADPDLAGSRS
jgi:hypothetical protein